MELKTGLLCAFLCWSLMTLPTFARPQLEPISGLVFQSQGLSCQEIIVAVEPNKQGRLAGRQISVAEQIVYQIKQPQGLTFKQNTVRYGVRFSVFNSSGKRLASKDLALTTDLKLAAGESLSQLSFTLKTRNMKLGKGHYLVQGEVYDAYGSGKLRFEHRFEIVPQIKHPREILWMTDSYPDGKKITSLNLKAEDFFLVDKVTGQDLPNYQFRRDQQVMMMFGHLEGFTISAGKAYPGVEMRIYDEQGQLVQNNADLMPGNAGVKASTAEGLVSATLTVSKQTFKPGKNYLWVVRVFDKKSYHQLITQLWFSVR